jgi:pimeloyl-ACP methyl ester carboxylesterase
MPHVKVSSNVRMHYIVPSSPDPNKPFIYPSRPTIIMLHPRFFDSHFFAPQFRDGRLTKAYNVVAIDHHYHGLTEVPLDSKPYDFDLVSYTRLIHEERSLTRWDLGGQGCFRCNGRSED